MAELILDAEVRLGELLEKINRVPKREPGGTFGKTLPPNIDKRQSHYAQQLSKHPDVVEEVKQKARERGELPVLVSKIGIVKESDFGNAGVTD